MNGSVKKSSEWNQSGVGTVVSHHLLETGSPVTAKHETVRRHLKVIQTRDVEEKMKSEFAKLFHCTEA